MLAIVRPGKLWPKLLEENEALKNIPKLVIQQEPVVHQEALFRTGRWKFVSPTIDKAYQNQSKAALFELLRDHKVTRVLVTQKLLWYSSVVEEVCQLLDIPIVWTEAFFDGRIILDKVGLQYCKLNEITYEACGAVESPVVPRNTREAQPPGMSPREIYKTYNVTGPFGAVVVFGQTPYDMSLIQYPWVGYEQWLDHLFECNRGTRFLFKHHPLCRTPGIERHPNAFSVNIDIQSLWNAFELFASFSSTTILEGCIRRKRFATGGYHFCSGNGLTIEAHSLDGIRDLTKRLSAFSLPAPELQRRVWFVCNRYTISMKSPQFLERLERPSEEFFR